jgi:glycosyl transferase family 25
VQVTEPIPHSAKQPNFTAFVISMTSAGERRSRMRAQMEHIPANWEFFDAHLSPIPELVLHPDKWRRINGRLLNKAEIGCYSSHYALWSRHSQAADDDLMLVLEDDALIDTDYLSDLAPLRTIMQRFGYIRFHCHLIAPAQTLYYQDRRRVLRFKRKVHGTLAYCIDAKTARTFRDRLKHVYRPVDVEMDRYWVHGVPIFCLYPFVAIERAAPTQIAGRDFERGALSDHVRWKFNNQVEKLRCGLAEATWLLRSGKGRSSKS